MKRLIARRDTDGRDAAITYIDGEILESYTHAECIDEYLQNKTGKGLNDYHGRPLKYDPEYWDPGYKPSEQDKEDQNAIDENIMQLGFAHKCDEDSSIYVEEESLHNVDLQTVVNAIKAHYPEYDIYRDGDDEKVARLKKTIKAYHDEFSRDCAFFYINGEVYTGQTHGDCVTEYIEDNDLDTTTTQPYDDIYEKYPAAFGHEKDHKVYLMEDMIYNTTLDAVAQKIKTYGYEVYNDNRHTVNENGETVYERVAKLKTADAYDWVKERAEHLMDISDMDSDMAYGVAWKQWKKKHPDWKSKEQKERLKKKKKKKKIAMLLTMANHDFENRDAAILYINGEVLEAESHAEAINEYLESMSKQKSGHDFMRPSLKEIDEIQLPMAFAHKFDDAIYVETDVLAFVDLQTVVSALKAKYPNMPIYDDIDFDIDDEGNQVYKKIARLIRSTHDIENRDYAIAYINGQIFTGYTHNEIINNYLKMLSKGQLNNTFSRPFLNPEYVKGFSAFEDDYNAIMNEIKSLGFGHVIDEDKTVYIEANSLMNCSMDEFANAAKRLYSGYSIYNDDTEPYEKVAKVK